MEHARPLPAVMARRYHGWHATEYAQNRAWFVHLAEEGQHPRAMVIACCDSRVHVSSVFGADSGEFFIHRNIANLVPPYVTDGDHHGTSAAVEYAVCGLHVAHLIVMGHSQCGGVKGCHDMCAGTAPELEKSTSFVGRWMDILRPGFERVRNIADLDERLGALERAGVATSLENLLTFPFVREAVEAGRLSLHGLWLDIGEGRLEYLDSGSGEFLPV